MDKDFSGLIVNSNRPTWLGRTVSVVAVLAVVLALAGCSTVQGLGKDVEKAGEAIQKSTK